MQVLVLIKGFKAECSLEAFRHCTVLTAYLNTLVSVLQVAFEFYCIYVLYIHSELYYLSCNIARVQLSTSPGPDLLHLVPTFSHHTANTQTNCAVHTHIRIILDSRTQRRVDFQQSRICYQVQLIYH